MLPISKPAARTRVAVSASNALPLAPAHCGWAVPKLLPISKTGCREQRIAGRVGGDVGVKTAPEAARRLGPVETGQVHRTP